MKNILGMIIVILSVTVSQSAEKTLTEFVAEEIETLDDSFTQMSTAENQSEEDEAFMFRRFWLRLRPRAGLHVPGFATFDVVPEIEMLWERDLPNGWETYRP